MHRSCRDCSHGRPLRLPMLYAALIRHVAVTWPCSDHRLHVHTASFPPTCKASPRRTGQLCQRCTLPLTAAMRAGSAMSCQHSKPLQDASSKCNAFVQASPKGGVILGLVLHHCRALTCCRQCAVGPSARDLWRNVWKQSDSLHLPNCRVCEIDGRGDCSDHHRMFMTFCQARLAAVDEHGRQRRTWARSACWGPWGAGRPAAARAASAGGSFPFGNTSAELGLAWPACAAVRLATACRSPGSVCHTCGRMLAGVYVTFSCPAVHGLKVDRIRGGCGWCCTSGEPRSHPAQHEEGHASCHDTFFSVLTLGSMTGAARQCVIMFRALMQDVAT